MTVLPTVAVGYDLARDSSVVTHFEACRSDPVASVRICPIKVGSDHMTVQGEGRTDGVRPAGI